jgi:adenylate cyclase
MCTFASAQVGLQAACAMQSAVEHSRYEGGNNMRIRIGFHYGSVICEGGGVFGDTVNVAARVAATARAHQIMTSQAVVDALPKAMRQQTHRLMAAEFKGTQTEFDIFIVVWAEDEAERTQIKAHPQAGPSV